TGNWQLMFVGLAFGMAWPSMGSPPVFALIAEHLPRDRRAMGFTVQALLKRVPIMLSPTLGGLLIAYYGLLRGFRTALFINIGLALVALGLQQRFYVGSTRQEPATNLSLLSQMNAMHPALKRLLISDVFIRTCEGMVNVFVVLY